MNLIAFILALIAVVTFLVEYGRSKSLTALGLAILTIAWIVQLTVSSSTMHIG